MMRVIPVTLLCILFSVPGFAQTGNLEMFPLSGVRLLNSPFKLAQETDRKYMLSLDADRLLAPFLKEAGMEPTASNYGNWENTGLDGHIGGHYLSALSNMYAATGDEQVAKRLNYMIGWLDKCQQKNGDGYVGGVPGGKAMWQQIANGNINAGTFSLNEKWVPLYNIHKLFAGLVDAYTIAGNQQAKVILVKLSDWLVGITANLSDDQIQKMLVSEHGGMNEAFADVAAITGDEKYIKLAKRLSHRKILDPLLQQKDELTGIHANTQIPKVIGFMRVAEIDGDKSWADAADFFWKTVTEHRTIAIGGNSVREHFNPTNNFTSMLESKEGPETCNSYNMLKLTKHLFLSHPDAAYMDYYERTLYNHILSSQHPDGGFVYFTPIRPMHYRVYSQPQLSFWCCVGSGLENHGKYGELIYAHNQKDVFVNLFIPSILQWKEKGMVLEQNNTFPYSEKTAIKLTLKSPLQFAVNFRYPSWVNPGMLKATVNNQPVNLQPGANGYVSVDRKWKSGDRLTITMPMETKAEFLPDSSQWFAFVRGPLVLAAATDTTGLTGLRADDSRMGHIANGPLYPIGASPMIVSAKKNFTGALQAVKDKPFTFTAAGIIYPDQYKQLQLVPFYTIHDTRYMLYWPYATPAQLETRKQSLHLNEASRLALESITVDQVAPGEQQPESDHNFKAKNTESGVFNDRHWRHASGWFSYDLKNPKLEARQLRITYYGMDKGRFFDIYVNDILLKSVELDGTKGDKFFDVDYPLPAGLENEKLLNIKFVAKTGSIAGGIYYLRLLK